MRLGLDAPALWVSDPWMRIGAHRIAERWEFCVWAPNADHVTLLWQRGEHWDAANVVRQPLDACELDQPGYWCGQVERMRAGDLYRFELVSRGKRIERLDPCARDVLFSELTRESHGGKNASILVDPTVHEWGPFETPRFEDFIIYELHVGTFCGRGDGLERPIATFGDVQTRLDYVRALGFNAIELMPVHEFALDRSWGYNPASFFAPESAYGTPAALRRLVDAAHGVGLAVIFDVVYNHAGPGDNVLWAYDGDDQDGGVYFRGGQQTRWGIGPAWHRPEVQDFFYENARMFLEEYRADGLRFDVTTQIDGRYLSQVTGRLRREFPSKLLIAEHLPTHPWVTTFGNFAATWDAETHHQIQRALDGDQPAQRLLGLLDLGGFEHSWNLVRYALGSHDDIGDDRGGDAEDGLDVWDSRHRYFVDLFGGRGNWWARAKCRVAWALTVTMPGTPLSFMGSECHMGAPEVAWGYWHDGVDANGDHRFDWAIANDAAALEMRRLVAACNELRWLERAFRSEGLDVCHVDEHNRVVAFRRWGEGSVALTIVNLSDRDFDGHQYKVFTGGQNGQWTQRLCTQDLAFGGWDGAGNAYYEPWTEAGAIAINLPKWSVIVMVLKA
jgi:1,4-alpha-glucan branching enzyme